MYSLNKPEARERPPSQPESIDVLAGMRSRRTSAFITNMLVKIPKWGISAGKYISMKYQNEFEAKKADYCEAGKVRT